MSEFEGKSVVITGAAGVLGRTVADAFHQQGSDVYGVDVIDFEAPFRTYHADLTVLDDAVRVVNEIGNVDILMNIAGGFTMGDSVVDTSDDTWDFMFNLNARTAFNMIRATVPKMKRQGHGKIVNIGARNGLRGVGMMASYSASKSVVIRLTESLADELKESSINVNCILPSIIDTPRNRQDMPKADFDKWVTPEAMARVAMFLASSDADPIHGAAIPVEGLS